jgi:outer membrane protein OmpA-like peptidoglycan-associated protein
MTRALLMLMVLSTTIACTTMRVIPPPPTTEVSGRWIGTWRSVDVMNIAREGEVTVDLAQDGAHGRGRMVWADTLITSVPESIRLAGALGVPVVFVVTGSTVVLRHETSARALAIQLTVQGDEIVGTSDAPAGAEIRLTRVVKPGGATTMERLGRLEADVRRDRDRMTGLDTRVTGIDTRVTGLTTATDQATGLARQALASATETTRIDDLERRIREGQNGKDGKDGKDGHATNGKTIRNVIHTLDVRFGFDKWELDPAGTTALAEIIELLKDNPELNAELEGYADALGSAGYNVQLSQRRVETVHRHLARQGVPLERIHIVGLGPLPETDADARAKNRRVTVKLLLGEE